MRPNFKVIAAFFPYLLVHEQCMGSRKKCKTCTPAATQTTYLDLERKVNSINF